MNSRSFTVVDDFHISAAAKLQQACDEIDSAISEYIRILNRVTAEAAKAGHTTERYEAYAGMISGLKGKFATIGSTLNAAALTFVSDIDDADSYLYE